MSCLGASYNPNPTRLWNRFENPCIFLNNVAQQQTNDIQMQLKGNILQYKKNNSNLSKKQHYAQIARGSKIVKRTYAIQTDKYTNPNIQNLPLSNNNISCATTSNSVQCFPTTDSDVPGPIMNLCYDKNAAWILQKRRTMYPGSGVSKQYKQHQQ